MAQQRLLAGLLAGLIGGLVFALILQATGFIAGAGALIGMEGEAMGWVVMLVWLAVLGVLYAALFGSAEQTWGRGIGYGLVYGAVWWAIVALLVMPLMLGEPLLAITEATWMNLVGYLVYGAILGATYVGITQRTRIAHDA